MRNHWTEIEKYLEDQKIAQELSGELRDFHMRYEVEDQVKGSQTKCNPSEEMKTASLRHYIWAFVIL